MTARETRITTSAPGKLLLLGEYAVLEGAPALVAAIDRRAEVIVERAEDSDFIIEAPDVGITRIAGRATDCWEGDVGRRLALVRACVDRVRALGQLPPPHLRIRASALMAAPGGEKLGMGSSAAVATALVGGLLKHAGRPPDERLLFETALSAHGQAQGHLGSGVDVAASVYGGVLRFERGQTPKKTPTPRRLGMPDGLDLVCVWSGRSASTTELVGGIRDFEQREPQDFAKSIQMLTDIAENGCAAFEAGDVAQFLRCVDDYCSGLAKLGSLTGVGIVSSEHQRIGGVVRSEGAVYKPSGAGGGDLGLAFSGSGETTERVKRALEDAGLTIIDTRIDDEGFRAWTHA